MPAHGHTTRQPQHLPNAVALMGATAEAEAEDVARAQNRQGGKAKAGAEAPTVARVLEETVSPRKSPNGAENRRGKRQDPKARSNKLRNLDDVARNADREVIRCSEACMD